MSNKKDKTSAEFGAEGGKARAEALSPEQRSEIARQAAEARWADHKTGIARETHSGVLTISGRELPCSVLEDGTRVFSISGLIRAVGSRRKGGGRSDDGSFQLPPFLATAGVKPFIPEDLLAPLLNPIPFRAKRGGAAIGYEATLLPRICEVILDAAKARPLRQRGSQMVETAEILLRGFARVGIIALVDEATGYQADRARDELNRILEAYISKELLPWTKRFPDEFFRQVYRLHGWEYKPGTIRGPRYVGKLVNKLVYQQLPPGVLDELKRVNPPNEKWHRRYRHHQFLSEEIGNVHLERQIIEVTTLMRVADDKHAFHHLFQKAFPKTGQQLLLLSGGDDTAD